MVEMSQTFSGFFYGLISKLIFEGYKYLLFDYVII